MDYAAFSAFAPSVSQTPLRHVISAMRLCDEAACVGPLLEAADLGDPLRRSIRETATRLVTALRAERRGSGVEALVQEYALSSQEGVALMCLAEALLRIPDDATRDALIRDKIAGGNWSGHLGGGKSLFVNAATWGLVVTGKLVSSADDKALSAALTRLVARAGEPVIRRGVNIAMRLLGEQFVVGETIGEAVHRAREQEAKGFRYSYDMLGEAATTAADAECYFEDYRRAIEAIGAAAGNAGIYRGPGISIKLSALHPRYARAQRDRVMTEMLPRVKALAVMACERNIGFNIDAEEADRLELSLDLLESLALDADLKGWDGLGFVVQAYGKRCPAVIDWIIDLARRSGRRIMVRLVKGAYWDAEIKRAQVDGLADFPVYTRKVHTDVAYIACARKLLGACDEVFPQFATHNAQTVATIYHLAGPDFAAGQYEFQCLHGMGEALYAQVVGAGKLDRPCRIYAPVGNHETLLAYLVRRLLENGANSSFVNRIGDPEVPVADLVADPVEVVRAAARPGTRHDRISLPQDIFPGRRNSAGMDLTDEIALKWLASELQASAKQEWSACADDGGAADRPVLNPADHSDVVGTVADATSDMAALAVSRAAASGWHGVPIAERAAMLERAADIMQDRMARLMGLAIREAGKSAANAVAEVREAIDFLRYYAKQARETLEGDYPQVGPVVCISPWNFPLAIFTGQVCAALVAGNPVLAKPAEETPLIAAEAVRILHQAGVPLDALQLLPGGGEVGAALVAAPETMGVMFTGSTEVARLIQRQLAGRLTDDGQPIPLIAETGGQNAMIVDSSALAEQVVGDVIASAFDSAGQRCSALRILCLQDDIADRTLAMLKGALAELRVGNPARLRTDVGPVITAEAQEIILTHIETMRAKGRRITQCPVTNEAQAGTFVAPTIIEIGSIAELGREVFGPVLHVMRFRRDELPDLIGAINATGYGLTFGLHTRLDGIVSQVTSRIRAGNLYVNRNTIGAVVGSQPFGGRGLSGTGPKAGGPLYLSRLVRKSPEVIGASAMPIALTEQFAAWLDRQGEAEAARIARDLAASSALGMERELPGPVGERNLYALHPRGVIALRPSTRAGMLGQMAAVLATGNRARIETMALPENLPPSVAQCFIADASHPFAACLVEGGGDAVRQACTELAQNEGPVVPVYTGPGPNLCWLLEEVSTSINTTAAGGNASLMAIG